MKQLASYEGQHCANCGASMQGEFCHECGQSIHSVLKPIHGMLEDTMDIVFHVDGRAVHTIPPLLLKPGFLTLEYFSGRRVRYIAPFRLMFVLSLLAFFVIHLQLDSLSDKIILHNHVPVISSGNDFQDAHSQTEVREQLKRQLAELDRARVAAQRGQTRYGRGRAKNARRGESATYRPWGDPHASSLAGVVPDGDGFND
jgi:hypothetical protein